MADEQPKSQGEQPAKRWSTRRRIAYISLTAVIVMAVAVTSIALTGDAEATRLEKIMTLLSTTAFGLLSLVGAYMGLSSIGKK